jgi:hypothetical protein
MANSERPPHLVYVGINKNNQAVYVQSDKEQQTTKSHSCYTYRFNNGILEIDYNSTSPLTRVEELGWCTDVVSFDLVCGQVPVPALATDNEKFSAWKSRLLDALTDVPGWERR